MIRYIETKSILSKLRHPDPWFGISYNMNLYRGCQHGCIYCDTRSECYGVGDISQIAVKKNALELLPAALQSKRRNKGTVGTGSMNDPYMPLEKEIQITQKALQIIADYKFPVHIITKSDLVNRDIEILKDISQTYAAVSLSITTANDHLAQKIEPYAPLSSLRFQTIGQLAKAGIYTGITLMPVLPYINDNWGNIETIVKKAKDAGASYIIPMFGVTLRKGSRDYFYQQLDHSFPGVKRYYEDYYKEKYECLSPISSSLYYKFRELTDQLKIESKIQFYEPPSTEQLSLFQTYKS